MGEVAIKLKVMPVGLDTDLEAIKNKGKEEIEKEGGKVNHYEEEPVAFGLKALIATISWNEEKSGDIVEEAFKKIEGVSSVDTIDYRRAFG